MPKDRIDDGEQAPVLRRWESAAASPRGRNLETFVQQLSAGNWLGKILAATRLQAADAVFGHRVGRQGNDRQLMAELADRAGGGVAVHLRHLHVHEHQVKFLCLDLLDRRPSVGGDDNFQARLAQVRGKEIFIVFPILGKQHAAAEITSGVAELLVGADSQLVHGQVRNDLDALARPAVKKESERASFAGSGCHDDVAAQQAGEGGWLMVRPSPGAAGIGGSSIHRLA